jgi:hypothetical protein
VRPFFRILYVGALLAACVSGPLAAQAPFSKTDGGGSFLRAEDYRVASVAYRLALAGKLYCPKLLPLTGLFLHYLPEYEGVNRAAAIRLYGIDRGPGALSVLADSPAARAGLRAGDVLLSLDGAPLPTGDELGRAGSGKKWRKAAAEMETRLEEKLRSGPVRLKVLREGRELDILLDSVPGCPIRSRLARSTQLNAFAEGRTAIITTRLLSFFRSDDELAMALAHEAAHNILGHPGQLEEEGVPNGILGEFGANAKRVRITEIEADRLGLKLLWSAGYDTSAVIPYWRRLYGRFDPLPMPKFFSRHPSLAARERIVRETLAELAANAAAASPQP